MVSNTMIVNGNKMNGIPFVIDTGLIACSIANIKKYKFAALENCSLRFLHIKLYRLYFVVEIALFTKNLCGLPISMTLLSCWSACFSCRDKSSELYFKRGTVSDPILQFSSMCCFCCSDGPGLLGRRCMLNLNRPG